MDGQQYVNSKGANLSKVIKKRQKRNEDHERKKNGIKIDLRDCTRQKGEIPERKIAKVISKAELFFL